MSKQAAKKPTTTAQGNSLFSQTLACYKASIDADIADYTKTLQTHTYEQFGAHSLQGLEALTEILNRGGKRIRGALTMLAYDMFGGADQQVAVQAARAIEILQSYMLIIDDIADRSTIRRGGPTAHILVQQWHEDQHLKDDAHHFGESIAMHAGLLGCHTAFEIISQLQVADELKVLAMTKLNQNLIVTAHGQFNDLYNEVLEVSDMATAENVMLWKTAYYTFVNPLQFGAILAGVTNGALDALQRYSLHAGRVFQITDDILGTFGNEFESGKSPMDDIREGKRTIIVTKALQNASKADRYFLEQALGNQHLTRAEFTQAKRIILASGALDFAKAEAETSAAAAAKELAHLDIKPAAKLFLEELVDYLLIRKS